MHETICTNFAFYIAFYVVCTNLSYLLQFCKFDIKFAENFCNFVLNFCKFANANLQKFGGAVFLDFEFKKWNENGNRLENEMKTPIGEEKGEEKEWKNK